MTALAVVFTCILTLLLFLVPAFLLGQRFRGQLFARTGGWFAGFLLAAFTLLYVLIGV